MNSTANCNFCKSTLFPGATWCKDCGQFQDWNNTCQFCMHPIHASAKICIQCNASVNEHRIIRFVKIFAFPVSSITSMVALILVMFNLGNAIESTVHIPAPIITIVPKEAKSDKIELTVFNSGDHIGYIKSIKIGILVFDKGAESDAENLGQFDLMVEEPTNSFLVAGKSQDLSLKAKHPNWSVTKIRNMQPQDREIYFSRELRCTLLINVQNTFNNKNIENIDLVLKNKECSKFLIFRY